MLAECSFSFLDQREWERLEPSLSLFPFFILSQIRQWNLLHKYYLLCLFNFLYRVFRISFNLFVSSLGIFRASWIILVACSLFLDEAVDIGVLKLSLELLFEDLLVSSEQNLTFSRSVSLTLSVLSIIWGCCFVHRYWHNLFKSISPSLH